jgi:hypothetical protein
MMELRIGGGGGIARAVVDVRTQDLRNVNLD